ncbi:MAG TPA: isocitrate lyase/PEP mutase family protein [Pseudolabrys sp.]
MKSLKALLNDGELVVAPVALNPVMARLAEDAGFKAVYLSGGSLGWLKCVTEANLSLTDMVEVAIDIRGATKIPIVLDAGGGWGEPVHIHRTIAMSEVAGFAAIELEDQYLPRRVQHHIGEENLISPESMVHKIKEAVAARTDPNLIIIGRTNARRLHGLDEALRRGEMYHRAGADMLFIHSRDAEELRRIASRLPAPLMMFAPQDGFANFEISPAELAALGYRLAASSGTAFAAMYKAARQSYDYLARGETDPFLGPGGAEAEMKRAHQTTGLARLLEIEKRTTERVR